MAAAVQLCMPYWMQPLWICANMLDNPLRLAPWMVKSADVARNARLSQTQRTERIVRIPKNLIDSGGWTSPISQAGLDDSNVCVFILIFHLLFSKFGFPLNQRPDPDRMTHTVMPGSWNLKSKKIFKYARMRVNSTFAMLQHVWSFGRKDTHLSQTHKNEEARVLPTKKRKNEK